MRAKIRAGEVKIFSFVFASFYRLKEGARGGGSYASKTAGDTLGMENNGFINYGIGVT